MSKKVNENKSVVKRNILDYGMEWFDYHMTSGLFISIAVAVLFFVFVFIGQFYREDITSHFPSLKVLDAFMTIYYLAYALILVFARKIMLAEDKRSFYLSLLMFLVRAAFHAFILVYLVITFGGIPNLDTTIFYTYIFYCAALITIVNVFNIFYFIRRKGIFEYEGSID